MVFRGRSVTIFLRVEPKSYINAQRGARTTSVQDDTSRNRVVWGRNSNGSNRPSPGARSKPPSFRGDTATTVKHTTFAHLSSNAYVVLADGNAGPQPGWRR